jgi:ABC-type methionine transport system ATPase subunit
MKQRVRLMFPQHLIKEPVIFTMAKNFDVMPNIRMARVTDSFGEMILELEGTEKQMTSGLNSLREMGISVEFIKDDIPE